MHVKESGVISWIKLKTNMFDDEKIQLIEQMPEKDSILIIWIRLLIQAGKVNQNGWIFMQRDIPYSAEDLSAIFRRPVNVVRLALETLKRFQMIEMDSEGIYVTNFPKHQSIEGMEKVREQNRLRQVTYRKRKKEPKKEIEDKKEEYIDIDKCVTHNVMVTLHDKVESIYKEYPRKIAKQDALKAINKALKERTFEFLLEKTKLYYKAREGQDSQFTPYPASWFNAGHYDDDPKEWVCNARNVTLVKLDRTDRDMISRLRSGIGSDGDKISDEEKNRIIQCLGDKCPKELKHF